MPRPGDANERGGTSTPSHLDRRGQRRVRGAGMVRSADARRRQIEDALERRRVRTPREPGDGQRRGRAHALGARPRPLPRSDRRLRSTSIRAGATRSPTTMKEDEREMDEAKGRLQAEEDRGRRLGDRDSRLHRPRRRSASSSAGAAPPTSRTSTSSRRPRTRRRSASTSWACPTRSRGRCRTPSSTSGGSRFGLGQHLHQHQPVLPRRDHGRRDRLARRHGQKVARRHDNAAHHARRGRRRR